MPVMQVPQWYTFNDEDVTPVQLTDIMRDVASQGYLLFYVNKAMPGIRHQPKR